MKILKLRFKNLNSLTGEWDIDLTHPAFVGDGIFAITGPTGAGKTTILDAICLGLYGRTPRLNKVTKSSNEIMSRQTGECFAEITFETQTGQYRCHWSQHRSRRKAEGELQAPKHEIVDVNSGTVLESKILEVAKQIEKTTGMDFDRFTRSMMLAQGGFAAFLQAPPDERAPILEQITGTGIYSQISICVHERRSEEHKALDGLEAKLAGLQLLTAEDQQRLADGLAQKVEDEQRLQHQLAIKVQAIHWLEGVDRIEQEVNQISQQYEAIEERITAFAPEQQKLDLANQALELAGDYSILSLLRREQKTDQCTLTNNQAAVPEREALAQEADKALRQAMDQLEAYKAEQQQALPILRKVRELDLKIAEKEAPIKEIEDSVVQRSLALESLRTKLMKDATDREKTDKSLSVLCQQLAESKVDEGLVEHLAGIKGRFEALKQVHVQGQKKGDELIQTDNQLTQASQVWQAQSASLDKKRQDWEAIQAHLADKQAALKTNMNGKDLAEWRNSVTQLTAQQERLNQAYTASQSLAQSTLAVAELNKRQVALGETQSNLVVQLQTEADKQATLEKEIELLETQLTLLRKIEDLTDARHQLQDGEACPLCGATEHPFALGNVPIPDETRKQLAVVRADNKAVITLISSLKVKQAQEIKDLEQIAVSLKEYEDKIADAKRLIEQVDSALPAHYALNVSDDTLCKTIECFQANNQQALVQATQVVQNAEEIDKEVQVLRESLEKAKEAVTQSERDTLNANHQKDAQAQLVERLKQEWKDYQQQEKKLLGSLQHELNPFGIDTLSVELLDQVEQQLVTRREQWLTRQQQKTTFEQTMAALDLQMRHLAEQIQRAEKELDQQQKQLATLIQAQKVLINERQSLFSDKQPDEEERRFNNAIESADKALENARHAGQSANQTLSQLKSKIEELIHEIAMRDSRLKAMEQAFQYRLNEFNFSDEQQYLSANLPENERKHLAQQSEVLVHQKVELLAKDREKRSLLESERDKKITEEPLARLKEALDELTGTVRTLQQEIGASDQKLKDNERLKHQQQEQLQAIEKQRQECTRWDLLHALIGSADGKKYRNFAQGLTFEMMMGHANRQLLKMTDRYLLIRDSAQPLELNVIDNYQAGEVRSTKNLSGGESFIISLSLALGLSNMASQNVRVDSLFLDEGFGTLDEDALDTALDTLSGLQQEGKLIGVISHVSALKERISTQIQVTPITGGRSVVSGLGCRQVDVNN